MQGSTPAGSTIYLSSTGRVPDSEAQVPGARENEAMRKWRKWQTRMDEDHVKCISAAGSNPAFRTTSV